MLTLNFEDEDVYHQVDVIKKHSCRLLMDITLAGPKTFNALAMLYFLNGIVTTKKQLKKIILPVFYFEE